jgi:small GTP-binding protein
MGNLHSIFNCTALKKEVNVLMIGLDGGGKTTILYKIQTSETVPTLPTVGYNLETVLHKNTKLVLRDAGGQGEIRDIWNIYYKNAQAVIFVFDCNERGRNEEAVAEFHRALKNEDLRQAIVLIYANKQVANLISQNRKLSIY